MTRSIVRIWPRSTGDAEPSTEWMGRLNEEMLTQSAGPQAKGVAIKPSYNEAEWAGLLTDAFATGNKSEVMRRLFEKGLSIADVSRFVDVPYGLAYSAHRRWRDSQGE